MMTREAKLMAGIIILTVPSIAYGGTFLLSVLSGQSDIPLTDFQKSMFRAGHAHAGVLVILSLVTLLFVDHTIYKEKIKWMLRSGFPLAAILISGGFFAAAIGNQLTKPNDLIWILWLGVAVFGISLVSLGLGLILSYKRH
jgi:hypothetical protein